MHKASINERNEDGASSLPHHYRYSDLYVQSDMPLPEWREFAVLPDAGDPDVLIHCVTHAAEESDGAEMIGATEYRFQIAGLADYRVCDGHQITVVPAGGDAAEVRLYLLGTAWAALTYQRGLLFLHASAIQIGSDAIAFCGASGAGKSSAVAWGLGHGGHFISDDLCRFSVTPLEGVLVYPSARRLKLWRDGLGHFEQERAVLQRDSLRLDKYHVAVNSVSDDRPVALTAICLLRWGEYRLTRLRGKNAVTRLLGAATYRPNILESIGRMAPYWQSCLELAGTVPIFELQRPKNFDTMDEIMDRLFIQLREINY